MTSLSKADDPGAAKQPAQGDAERTQVRITLTPYASALPLASLAFGIGNVLFAAFLLDWIPPSESRSLALVLLAFVAPLELFPSAMAFLSRDTGGATAFAIFGAAWIVQGLELLVSGGQAGPSATAAFFFGMLALTQLILAVITFRGKPLLGGLLVVATLRTVGAALLQAGVAHHLAPVTAGLGLLLAILAFYAAMAFLEEDVTGRISPLTFRTGQAKAAMEGRLEDQVEALTREAGVRKQL